MAVKGLKDLVKRERERTLPLAPLYEFENWVEDVWNRPFTLLRPSFFTDTDLGAEVYGITPNVDIFEEGKEFVLKIDLPGMKKEDIKVDITENMLTISGERTKTEKIEKAGYFRHERTFGTFERRFELPGNLDTEKVTAHYEHGVLELRIPMLKEAEKKHVKISIE